MNKASETLKARLVCLYLSARHGGQRLWGLCAGKGWTTPWERYLADDRQSRLFDGLDLSASSTVVEFGGYLGDTCARLRESFDCRVIVFEPVPRFSATINNRFADDQAVTVQAFGVGPVDEFRTLFVQGDATSLFSRGAEQTSAPFRSAEAAASLLDHSLDLVIMNIEGGEYELLPLLSEAGVLERAAFVLVQFHRIGYRFRWQRWQCTRALAQSHELVWRYEYVWELWKK